MADLSISTFSCISFCFIQFWPLLLGVYTLKTLSPFLVGLLSLSIWGEKIVFPTVSNCGFIFKFCNVFWSVWFIWYCLGSYWSLSMLPQWARQTFPNQPGVSPGGEGLCWDHFISACVALISPRWQKNVSACGNKQDSKTRTLAETAFLFLIPPVSLCRGEEFQAC